MFRLASQGQLIEITLDMKHLFISLLLQNTFNNMILKEIYHIKLRSVSPAQLQSLSVSLLSPWINLQKPFFFLITVVNSKIL